MKYPLIINTENIDFAFKQVRAINIQNNSTDLATLLDGVLQGKISSAWDSIEKTIKRAYMLGRDMIQNEIDATIQKVEDLLKEAGTKVELVHNKLLTMLQTFLKNLIDGAVKLIPPFITVGEDKFPINKISYSQKLVLGGSLKTSLLEAISITSNGELELLVEYLKKE